FTTKDENLPSPFGRGVGGEGLFSNQNSPFCISTRPELRYVLSQSQRSSSPVCATKNRFIVYAARCGAILPSTRRSNRSNRECQRSCQRHSSRTSACRPGSVVAPKKATPKISTRRARL